MLPSWLASVPGLFARRFGRRRGRGLRRPDRTENGIPERLEERRVMAFDILAAFAQSDTPFFVSGQSASTLTEAPQQITLRFSSGVKIDPATLGAITVVRAGGDNVVGNGNDVNLTPANGVGIVAVDDFPNENQVVLRFAETLPDDRYRITIGGGLKTLAGGPAAPADSFRGGSPFNIDVRLDLGAQVVAVVPQPISRVGATTALQQALDTVEVYFNANDPLQANSAGNPRNYRLVETDPATGADVAVQIPQTVNYDAASGKATLTFAAALGDKLYRLQVGGSDDDNGTIATAVPVGTVFQQSVASTPAFTTNSFLGDGAALANDVDLYKTALAGPGTLTFKVTPSAGFTPALRLFDSTGVAITTGVDTSQPNAISFAATAAGSFYVGISSAGNIAYNPITGLGATGGTTRGGYRLEISSTVAVPTADPSGTNTNSSFAKATGLGTLGLAGQAFGARIDVLPSIPTPVDPLLFPSFPGTTDEPGHRDIQLPVESHAMPAATLEPAGQTFVKRYEFPEFYGVDGQGNPLRNAITENQKQRAREVFELYSRATGVRFVETLTKLPGETALAVVTGDVRAIDPTISAAAVSGLCGGNLVVMDSTEDWGTSEYGGQWQSVAFHEIGHALGLGHSYDIKSNMGGDGPTVLPGDYDLQHLLVLHPPLGTDIDVYSFQLESDGTLAAETIVARPGQAVASQLDTVLTLYREDPATGRREMIARNDDYFGRDSFVGLALKAAAPSSAKFTYYLAVSSTGNTAFNPEVENSGANGRSDGDYRLQLGFTPAGVASNTIVDTTSTPLDGDRDGLAGGAFNFWFRSSTEKTIETETNTVYVDKLASASGADGSLTKPFKTVAAGLAAAGGSKAIVRIVGNSPGAQADPYLVGTNLAGTQPLADGASFVVPKDVTVMIDAGAVFKLRRQVIDVGSSSQLLSRAGAALQVLGTPGNRVHFTSYHDDSLGRDSDGVGPAVTGGQWGGIVFRQDSDSATKRVFLNSVSQANFRYGGGRVTINSQEQSISPLHLEASRPTIAFNDVRNSLGAAISADPNSFEESNGRAGPTIRGNVVRDNSLNGLLVRIRTEFGKAIDRLTVPARLVSPDITYIVPENLFIAGGVGGYQTRVLQKTGNVTAGSSVISGLADVDGLAVGMPVVGPGVPGGVKIGSIDSANKSITLVPQADVASTAAIQSGSGVALSFDTGIVEARASGRLAIDPGVVVKLQSSRIELERGNAQLYAEGTPQKRVIFTSTRDNRYGAGGTFVATGTTANVPAAGNWGGIVVNDAAAASIDNAVISFGGGQTPIEGGFASFSTLSVDQGSLRLASSRFENNATGIYVLGAQPVIVGNDFRSNGGDLISVDANSLNSREMPDPGRSTGPIGRYATYDDNRGPLVRGNRVTSGGVTGMIVRGDEITCESVWDDTDIVHVVRDEIFVTNFHVTTGLRLMSSPTASLVVKLLGPAAGLTATGEPADIDDRIGGTLQVIGQPGYPVILTSLADDSVGASLDPVGRTVTDTNGNGAGSRPVAGDWRGLRFLPYSNDRNVAVLRETEPGVSGGVEANALPDTAQTLGALAPNESGGDDNQRLGFEVHGTIAHDDPNDIDVYSFSGYVGSEVWIDVDYTSSSLDAMVELLDEAGNVLARSADIQTDASLSSSTRGSGLPFQKSIPLGRDLLSTNPRDPGMRVVLPGAKAGAVTNYYVRVRSQPRTAPNALSTEYQARLQDADPVAAGNQVDQGATSGNYQLRVRLRQLDEKPGSTVRYADIRYPVVGVDVQGLPQRSPLTGDVGENPVDTTNDATANPLPAAQYVGNLLATDLNTISIAGSILSESDVDWYSFDVSYEQIQAIGGVNGGLKTFSTVFDIDYADGFRGDLTLSVFDAQGRLIFVGRDSNVADDQPLPGASLFGDVSRGSAGMLDPFIGPVHLPAGTGGPQRYYVAVSSNERLPTTLDMTFKNAATNAAIRLEPNNTVRRLIEDRIDRQGYRSGEKVLGDEFSDYTFVAPAKGPLFDLGNFANQVKPITLAKVDRYVAWQPKEEETAVLPDGTLADDLAMRADGWLYSYTGVPGGVNTAGQLKGVSIKPSLSPREGTDNIPNFPAKVEPTKLTDDVASVTTTSVVATVTTFKLDAQGTQAGKVVDFGTVKGDLQYTYTPPGEPLQRTSTWTFASDAAGALTFAPQGTLPPNTPLPSNAQSTVNADGTLSLTWLDGGASATVVVAGLSMTNVEYTFEPEVPPESVTTDNVDALAWHRTADKTLIYDELYYSVRDVDPLTIDPATKALRETGVSRLYGADPITGVAADLPGGGIAPGGLIGLIKTAGTNALGLTTGMAFLGDTLYGVDNLGNLFTIDRETAVATVLGRVEVNGAPANLQGLANGPQNVAGGPSSTPGYFADKLFIIDADGFLFCVAPPTTAPATPGPLTLLPVFPNEATGILNATSMYLGAVNSDTGAKVLTGAVTGFAFSPVDFPLWRPTLNRKDDAGHGVTLALDNTRDGQFSNDRGSKFAEAVGGASIYYGFDSSTGKTVGGDPVAPVGLAPGSTSLADLASGIGTAIANIPAPGMKPVTLTPCSTTLGSSVVGVPTTRDLEVDMLVEGLGIPSGARIRSIEDARTITISDSVFATPLPGADPLVLTFRRETAIEMLPFSLAGYTYNDKPTLYFNYLIRAGAGSTTLEASTDGGTRWITIAANEHERSDLDTSNKTLPNFASVSSAISKQPNQVVQELFEGSTWRQSRIDIGQFAGANDVRLRLKFAAVPLEGSTDVEGAYFDDFIVGFAERGEMVTGQTTGDTGFFDIGTPASRTVPQQTLSGPYQLEIRRGMEVGMLTTQNNKAVQILGDPNPPFNRLTPMNVLDTNVRRVRGTLHPAASGTWSTTGFGGVHPGQNLRGDENTPRGQGQFIIEGNVVSHADQYGIRVDAAARDADTGASTMGVVKNTPVLNASRLVPGVVIVNNVVANTHREAGILFSGDPNTAAGAAAPVPYGRIVNNTIYGGRQVTAGTTTLGSAVVTLQTTANLWVDMVVSGAGIPAGARILSIDSATQIRLSAAATSAGTDVALAFDFQTTGVRVTDNAAPTLLNNVFSSLTNGIEVDASSTGTVVGFSAFHATPPGVSGDNAVTLTTDPFVNAVRGNFYPAAKSLVIDSAIDVLQDRAAYVATTQPLGIPLSPIIAPGTDMFGQRRSDDPGQDTPPGIGSEVFKDLGAIDRVDFVQPFASLAEPLDGTGADKNPAPDQVRLEIADARSIAKFELQLADVGVGIDKTTVVAEAFEVRRDGSLLVEGTDYSFSYLESSNRVVFDAAAIFPMGNYVISVVRAPVNGVMTNVITDLAGNPLLPNQLDGTTIFSIELADVPTPPSALVATSSDGQASLTWTAANGTLVGYELQRATTSTFSGATTINVPAAGVTYTDTTVVNGTQYWYRLRAVNAVGESEWSNVASVTPLKVPTLSLATDTGSSGTDGNTSNGQINVGNLETGAAWQYRANGGTWLTGTGTSFTLAAGTYAIGSIEVRQSVGGSVSSPGLNATAIVVDTAAAAPTLALASDAGSSSTDGITNSGIVNVSGIETGALWQFSTDGGATWTNGTGTSFTLPTGTYAAGSVRVRQTDLAGNQSPEGMSAIAFTIEVTTPAAPAFALASDTGSNNSDGITSDGTVNVSGIEIGATWQFSTNGGSTWTNGTVNSFTLPANTYAANAVRIRQISLAGNQSPEFTNANAIVVVSAAPAAPTFALASDAGSSSSDGVTNDGLVNVTGIEPAATWRFSTNGGTSWTAGSGTSFTLPAGTYAVGAVRVIQTNLVGTDSLERTNATAIVIDLTAPAAPSFALASDTGSSNSDGITNNGTVNVTGIDVNAGWQFSTNGGSSWTTGTGTSFTLPAGAYAPNAVRIRQVDLAGNRSIEFTNVNTITIDTTALAPAFALAEDTGSSSSDGITNNGVVNVTGIETGATWQSSINDGPWTAGTGSSFTLPAGTYAAGAVRVRQTDLAGNTTVNPSQNASTIVVDLTAPAAPSFALASDTGSSNSDGITSNGRINVTGIEAGASWQFSTDGGTTWTNGTGTSFTLPTGTYAVGAVRVRQADRANNQSSDSQNSGELIVDTTAEALTFALASDTGSNASDGITNNGLINVSGIEPGASWQYSTNRGSSWTNGTGTTFTLPAGNYAAGAVRVRQTDISGNTTTTPAQNASAIVVDLTTPAAPTFALATDTGSSNTDRNTTVGTVNVSGLETGAAWQYSTDSGSTWTNGTGTSFTLPASTYAAGAVRVRQTDVAGNTTAMPFQNANTIVIDQTAPAAPTFALASDAGSSNSDGITNNGIVNVSGIEPGASWQFSTNSGSNWTNGTGTSFTLPAGTYAAGTVRVRQTDLAGNTTATPFQNASAIVVDLTAPAAPTFALAVDTGSSDSDRNTSDGTVNVSGIESGASWQFSTNSGATWTNGSGSSFTLPAGNYVAGAVRVRQIDVAGNTTASPAQNASTIIIDLTAPAAPSAALAVDTGSSSSDSITNNGLVFVSGLEPGSTWQYSTDSGSTWTNTTGTLFTLPAGTYAAGTVRVRQTDLAGNTTATPVQNSSGIVVDLTAPVAPSFALAADTGSSNSDGVTNNGILNVTGLEPGASWQFSTNGGSTWANGTGTSFTLPSGTYNAGAVRVRQTDVAGNLGSERATTVAITVDTAAAALSLSLAADTGSRSTDGITNNGLMNVVGIEAGASWQFSTDGGSTWTNGTGTSFTLPAGTYAAGTVRVRQTDVAGNATATPVQNSIAIVVDLTAPAAPTFALAADTGSSNSDGITNSGLVNVSGIESGALWQFSTNSGSTWTNGTGTSFTLPAGTYAAGTVRVRQTDVAGNTSATPSQNAGAVVVDLTGPAAPTFALAADTGSSNSDGITNNGVVNVAGIEPGAVWQFSTNSGSTWTNGTGTSFTLPAGTYAAGTVRVRQTDVAGNTSAAPSQNAGAIIIDLTEPASPLAALAIDTGSSNSDGITNNGVVNVSGIESGASWQFSSNSGSTWTNGTGTSFTLPAGTYAVGTVRVRQTDVASNTASTPVQNSIAIVVDLTAPAAPTFALAADTGSSNSDGITNSGLVNVSGIESGALWQFSTDSGSTWTNGTGTSFTLPAGTCAAGAVRVRQTDVAGNTSATPSQNASAVTVDLTGPAAPTFALAVDTGSSSSDGITNNGVVNVAGIEPGAVWQFSTNSGSTWTNGTGTSFTLPAGTYAAGAVRVRQTDVAGNTTATPSQNAGAITVDLTGPAAPTFALAADTGSSSSDGITNSGLVNVSGIESGALWQFSTDSGSTWTNGTGTSFTLPAGTYAVGAVRVRQTDVAGNTSVTPSQNASAVTVDLTGPAAPTFALAVDTGPSSSDGITNSGLVNVSGIEPGALWQFSTNRGSTWTNGSGTSFTLPAGTYAAGAVRVRQTDVAGNTTGTPSQNAGAIIIDLTEPAAPSAALAIDTGSNNSDGVTNNGVVNVSGIESGALWQFSTNSGSTWTNGTGTSFTLPAGTYAVGAVRVRQTDVAGNTTSTPVQNSIAITVDLTGPAAPTFALAADTGSSNSDGITNSGLVNVSGIESGASWQFSTNSGSTWTNGTGTAFTLPAGTYAAGAVRVRQTDVAGNTSATPSQNAGAVTVDLTGPAAPTFALAADTGSSSSDGITNNGVVNVSGIESGASWQFSTNSGSTWTNGTGTSFSLPAGTYAAGAVRVRQTDLAGNQSPDRVSTSAIAVDTTSPAAPTLALGVGVDNGATAAEAKRVSGVVTVTGEAGAALSVTFQSNSAAVTRNIVATGSSQPISLTDAELAQLVNGAISVSATQTDVAGNPQAAPPTTTSFTLDRIVPRVTNVSSSLADGTYGIGQEVAIQVTFQEAVVVTDVPTLALNTSPQRTATYVSGTGTRVLTFRYTVLAGDASADLNYASTAALTGGTIRDRAGNLATRTLPGLAVAGSLGTNKNIVIDGAIRATASGFGTAADGPSFTTSAIGTVPITFNAPVTGVSLSSLKLYYEGQLISLTGATVTGSGTTWTLSLPATATNLRGRYRLDIGGPTSGIVSGSAVMNGVTSIFWQMA